MAGPAQQGLTDHHAILQSLGFPSATRMAGGMDGEVYQLGDGLVAKVWKQAADVALLRDFYAELGDQGLSFRTPEIVRIERIDGTVVSIERELPGRTLQALQRGGDISTGEARKIFLSVLEELRRTHAGPAAERLAVMNEPSPFRSGGKTWTEALRRLLDRRLARFGDQLARRVTDLDRKVERLRARLTELPDNHAIVHGDICPENILLDDSGRLTALLDWGFLTTSGDPALDASTAAGFFNMYGETARADDEALLDRLAPIHGRDVLLMYRAAYAMIGGNAYDPYGRDGHFQWCVDQLNREDVTALLTR